MSVDQLKKVEGEDCLNFIDKPIGLANKCNLVDLSDYLLYQDGQMPLNVSCSMINPDPAYDYSNYDMRLWYHDEVTLSKYNHDINKKIVGYVMEEYEDGGLKVAILGTDSINSNNIKTYQHSLNLLGKRHYNLDVIHVKIELTPDYMYYPQVDGDVRNCHSNESKSQLSTGGGYEDIGFDDMLDYNIGSFDEIPYVVDNNRLKTSNLGPDVPSNTIAVYGDGLNNVNIRFDGDKLFNPLVYLQGDLYYLVTHMNDVLAGACISTFDTMDEFERFSVNVGAFLESFNGVSIPYNIILTKNLSFAQNYLTNGTLPSDAFLYPLDWADLPSFDKSQEVNPDDVPNNNNPGNNDRIVIPNPPVKPSHIPAQFSNYNWYWLSIADYSDFINWFWNDVGLSSSFESIMAKIEGLYNNLSSAVIMARFYPVEYKWITGIDISNAPTDPIKVGMIEKSGTVTTIDQSQGIPIRKIGHKKIDSTYDSFMDLAPYSQLSLYLPYHGFVDLDINIFNGHSIDVYGIYDYLSGTLQYLVYYDDKALVNSFVVKLAIDIPISLQTKNDRDSAIFQNVSSAVGGLIGAGAGIMSGNPIGMVMGVTQGVQAINSANASAPLNIRGTVGETGAYYAPPQCAIVLRRPTIQPSDKGNKLTTWIADVGQLCAYGCNLSGLNGYTQCAEPRIDFKKTTPLQSEVEEIYKYLKEGVIL